MESGYKVLWIDHALKELKKLSVEIHNVLKLISKKPNLFPISQSKGVHRVVIKKFNTMYYRAKENTIEILSFFSNRQHPDNREI